LSHQGAAPTCRSKRPEAVAAAGALLLQCLYGASSPTVVNGRLLVLRPVVVLVLVLVLLLGLSDDVIDSFYPLLLLFLMSFE